MTPRIFFVRDPVSRKKRPVIWLPNAQGSFHATTNGTAPLCHATTILLSDPGDDDARSRDVLACVHCQNLVKCRVVRCG